MRARDSNDVGVMESARTSSIRGPYLTKPVSHPMSSPIVPVDPVTPSSLSGMSVFLALSNRKKQILGELSLKAAGAMLARTSVMLANIVISDLPLESFPKASSRTRGARLVKSTEDIPVPYVFYEPSQVDWLFSAPIDPSQNPIVVADMKSIFRPSYQFMSAIPVIHDDPVPKGYTLSPFSEVPDDLEPIMEKIRIQSTNPPKLEPMNGPIGSGYCELCGTSFKDPIEHRNSKSHADMCRSFFWSEFESISLSISQKKPNQGKEAPFF